MDNPLLEPFALPPFARLRPGHAQPAVLSCLARNRQRIAELTVDPTAIDWRGFAAVLELLDERLERIWAPIRHMHAVMDSPAWREAYKASLAAITEYSTEVGQNQALYRGYQALVAQPGFSAQPVARQRVAENALRDFRLSGVALESAQREQFAANKKRLAELASEFEEQVLDATGAWTWHIVDAETLAGLPPGMLSVCRQNARRKSLDGWLLTLDLPVFLAIMSHVRDRDVRQRVYHAYTTRASDQGPHAGRFDNSARIDELLHLRHEQARLLGYANFAVLSLAKKMAATPGEVTGFLDDLARRAKPAAERERAELADFARREYGIEDLSAHDIAFVSERLRERKFALEDEELRPYFPAPRVIEGLFAVVNRLYGLQVEADETVDTWHEKVTFYRLKDADGTPRGGFYLDPYTREHKRSGAWMDECLWRMVDEGGAQQPIAFLTTNFTPPVGDRPALLSHDEVVTLFHEFGHGLQHLLTTVDEPAVAGINGVPWDAVELPSQFMEHWCWAPQVLDLISGHWQTGAPMPREWRDRLIASRHFQAGMHSLRQLEFALFDFRLHAEYNPESPRAVLALLDEIRRQVAVVIPPAFNRFPCAFTHIFSGGYAAGYYSYKWAEVLAADAFSVFEEQGIFNTDAGQRFRGAILESGGVRDALDLFVEFRGREPSIDAYLRLSGIETGETVQ